MTGGEGSGYVPWHRPSPVNDAIGGFLRHPTDLSRLGFEVDERKTNARGFLHGGVIAVIGDAAIGHVLAAATDPPSSLLTVNLSCDLLATAALGQWVEVEVTPTRVGRRLAAGIAIFITSGRKIAVVTGLFVPAAEPAPG